VGHVIYKGSAIGFMASEELAAYIVKLLNADIERTAPNYAATEEDVRRFGDGGKVYVTEALREELHGDR
jgi:hypothetical protein